MIRAACIGTGGICGVHLGYLKARDDVEIVALCDVKEENLKRRQAEYGGEAFTDFREMLARSKPDAVWICTPPQVREEPLLACADAGIPVLCEKPVERQLDAAERIASALKERDARVQIGYLFRSMPVVRALKKEMADDRIHLVRSYYSCPMSLRDDRTSWFFDKELSGGALVDQATHNLDLLRYLFGEVGDVSEIRGVASNPVHEKAPGYTIDEAISLSFVFEDGTVGSHDHTWVGDSWRNEMMLCGEKRLYRLSISKMRIVIEEGGEDRTVEPEHGPMHHDQNAVFLETLASGDWSRNPCDYADGVKTLALTLECDRAVSER